MNRNTLLIGIAAIVVVGIVVGLFLDGAGNRGSFRARSLRRTPRSTCGAGIIEEAGDRAASPEPPREAQQRCRRRLAGKTVTVYNKYPSSSTYQPLPAVTAGADGTYAYQ